LSKEPALSLSKEPALSLSKGFVTGPQGLCPELVEGMRALPLM